MNRLFFIFLIALISTNLSAQSKKDYTVIGTDTIKITIAGKTSGVFVKEAICRVQMLKVSNPNYSIESFYFSSNKKASLLIFNNTANLCDDIKKYLKTVESGEELKIDSIRVKNKAGKTFDAPAIIITIK